MSDTAPGQDSVVVALHEDGTREVHGVRLRSPVRTRSARAAVATYLVRADRARTLVAGTGLDLVAAAGRTPLVLALVEYRESDLGAYAEVGVALLVRHRGRTSPYVHQLPVTQPFPRATRDDGGRSRAVGPPKRLARTELAIEGRHARAHLADDSGHHVLTAVLRAVAPRLPLTVPGSVTAPAPHPGGVCASRVRPRVGGGRGASLVLGRGHPMADELRALELPRRPLAVVTADRVALEIDAALDVPR